MPVSTDTAERIAMEVTLGEDPAKKDTKEESEFRIFVGLQIDEIRKRGSIVDIPSEWPDPMD